MANIRQINVGGTTYDIAPSTNPNANTDGIFYVTCDTGSTTSVIKSNLNLTSYYTGLKIVLYYSLATSSTSPSININNLGNKVIKRYSGSALQAGFVTGSMHFLCYNGTYFIESNYGTTDTHDYINPVSGTPDELIAPGILTSAENIGPGVIIYKGLVDDSNVYMLGSNAGSRKVNPDWGLGVYIGTPKRPGSSINRNKIIQQGFVHLDEYYIKNPYYNSGGLPVDSVTYPLYAFFHYNGSEILSMDNTLYTRIPDIDDVDQRNRNTFIYLGLVTFTANNTDIYILSSNASFDIDISDHDFITITYNNGNPVITHINGRSVGGGNATYDNPVSPNSYTLLASANFNPDTLLFKCTDGMAHRITDTASPIDPDWGLGYLTQYTEGKSFTEPNTVFQQYMINSSSGSFPYLYNYNFGDELYLCCDFFGNQIFSLDFIGTYSECQAYHNSNGSGDFTYIYLGIVSSIDGSANNDAGKVLALDLSNHDFITVGTLSAQDQKAAVKAINGRRLHDSDSSTGGWDGICDNAQTYSYLANRTVNPSAYHYPCVVTRYENKAFLYTLDSSERGSYVAYAHVTVHNDDTVQHTVEISLCANTVGLTSGDPATPVWSDIVQKTVTYLEIPPYRSATVHMTTPVIYDYKDGGATQLLGYGFVIRNDENRHCSIIGAHEASIIVNPNQITPVGSADVSIVHQRGRQFYRAAQFDVSGEKPQYAWCSSGVINNLSAAGDIIYTSEDTPMVTPGYITVDGSIVSAVFKGINPSTGGGNTGTTCGVYQIGTGFGNNGNSYSYVSVPVN